MFDLIIAYLVIMFLVNTAKSAKEQQRKGTENQKGASSKKPIGKYAPYGNKRFPAKKQAESLPEKPVSRPMQAAGPTVVCANEKREKPRSQPTAAPAHNATQAVNQPAARTKVAAVVNEEYRLREILEPTEENILTGLIWSDILGPPVCKRPRRY